MILWERESLNHGLVDHGLDHRLVVLGVLSAFGALGALGVGALLFFFLIVALY